jgi:hypothetical protein
MASVLSEKMFEYILISISYKYFKRDGTYGTMRGVARSQEGSADAGGVRLNSSGRSGNIATL